jgi:antitoxin component YwqK of YwqJK toxin-antitoxin module
MTEVIETYYENGQLESRSNFKNGNLNGLHETWYDNGQNT